MSKFQLTDTTTIHSERFTQIKNNIIEQNVLGIIRLISNKNILIEYNGSRDVSDD